MKSISQFAHFISSDINFDQLGTELLQQQPLLSSQIIPELTDETFTVRQTIKPEPITTTPKQQNVYKVIQSNTTKSVPFKTSATPQKVQIVKKIAANVVQQMPDSKPNVTTNSPIVINKVNGNISGEITKMKKIHFLGQILIWCFSIQVFERWYKWKKDLIKSRSFFRFHWKMALIFVP